jgi:hypothetical protein
MEKEKETKMSNENWSEGWEDISSDKSAPWFVKSEGATVIGILVGRFTFRDGDGKEKAYYQVHLRNDGVVCSKGKGDKKEEIICNKGDTVSIDETKALEDLAPFMTDGGKYGVKIVVGSKDKVPGTGRTFWNMSVQKKVLSPPTRNPIVPPSKKNSTEDKEMDDIPF